jgi:hypothetical protein
LTLPLLAPLLREPRKERPISLDDNVAGGVFAVTMELGLGIDDDDGGATGGGVEGRTG